MVGYVIGVMTVRKERRQRGGTYWVGYDRAQGRVQKIYVGRSLQVTHTRLDAIARTFLAAHEVMQHVAARDDGAGPGTSRSSKEVMEHGKH